MIKEKKLNKKLLAAIAFLLFITVIVAFKVFLTNPAGVDQEFYKDHLYVYETVMKAFEEERQLTSYEQNNIEEIRSNWDKEMDRFVNHEKYHIMSSIRVSTISMSVRYKTAMHEVFDDESRKEHLQDFIEMQKVAMADLKLSVRHN